MGINYRKRVKALPGVTLNFSKKGISTTIGGKGASINIGKNGVYGNAGIPGTGIYSREKISGDKANGRITRKQEYNRGYPQKGLFEVTPEQIEKTSTKEAVFGCLSVVICFVAGVTIGVLFDSLLLAIFISVLPFIVLLIFKNIK